MAAFTVIDHRVWVSKKDGKEYRDQPRLYICKTITLGTLMSYALKRDGLDRWTVDILRKGPTAARVGNIFDFIERRELSDLKKRYFFKDEKNKKLVTNFKPADYQKELPFVSEKDLRQMGFGNPGIGSEQELTEESFTTSLDEGYTFEEDTETVTQPEPKAAPQTVTAIKPKAGPKPEDGTLAEPPFEMADDHDIPDGEYSFVDEL